MKTSRTNMKATLFLLLAALAFTNAIAWSGYGPEKGGVVTAY